MDEQATSSARQSAASDGRRWGVVALAVVAVAAIAALSIVFLTGGDDDDASPTTTAAGGEQFLPLDMSGGIDASALQSGGILLEPIDVATVHAFTDSAGNVPEKSPSVGLPALSVPTTTSPLPDGQVAVAQIAGNEPGLYGGTREMSTCDADKLASFLGANPDKADAWAKVHGIEPAEIEPYIKGLTPLTLTRDTRLTNHGFADGKAVAHQSILQAGHSVFVDDFGVPRAKCSCGNPLAPAEPVAGTPMYFGTPWAGFDTTLVVVVVAVTPVDGGFTIVDLETGELITVPVGERSVSDTDTNTNTDTDTDATTDTDTVAPDTSTPEVAPTPEGEEIELLNVGNILAVTPGAAGPSFTVTQDTLITSIQNYHYGPETPPGQIGLLTSDGTLVGPWQSVGTEGQGGVANAYWTVTPNQVVGPGTYTVWDSEPSTWSTNADAGGLGFSVVTGVVVSRDVG
jgi:hypothetical protein